MDAAGKDGASGACSVKYPRGSEAATLGARRRAAKSETRPETMRARFFMSCELILS
jgi:hypothetical protein